METPDPYLVQSLEALTNLYDIPTERVILKQLDYLDAYGRQLIAASPLMMLATNGPNGVDCSPRGDYPGFAEVLDEKTILLPDRRGNNRLDSLKNIVQNPAVGLLFFFPGLFETFRVNGKAVISTRPDLLERFVHEGKKPRTVLVITVEEAFMQCARALLRADVWNPDTFLKKGDLPSIGTIMQAHTKGNVDACEYDSVMRPAMTKTLY